MGRKDKDINEEEEHIRGIGARMRLARQAGGINLTEMARRLGYTKNYLSAIENGNGNPSSDLIGMYERELELVQGELSEESPAIEKEKPLIKYENNERKIYEDWGQAPNVDRFYGRERELTDLERWIIEDNCRIIVIMGMGGIGKTALATKLAEQVKSDFHYVFWRSLGTAPTLNNLLKDILTLFSHQKELPSAIEQRIDLVLNYLRENRCLLVLDNFEILLQEGQRVGHYRKENEDYRKFLIALGERKHESCVIVTSREKPQEIVPLESIVSPVRSWRLSGVGELEGRSILDERELVQSDEECRTLVEIYSGNPLALTLVSAYIVDVFHNRVAAFLENQLLVFGGIRELIEKQFQRLSVLEQEIMYWLAIHRESMSFEEIQMYLLRYTSVSDILSLRQRSLIERDDVRRAFSLQPVIIEFVTNKFINTILKEIDDEEFDLFKSHALMIAQAKDYVRNTQLRLIVLPLIDRLVTAYQKSGTEIKLKNILEELHRKQPVEKNYLAGNILNLLIQSHYNLRGYDFSHFTVWQGYLQSAELPEVNFAGADLKGSVFTETFGSIFSVALSPDGKLMAVGTANSEIRTWQIDDGAPLLTYRDHTDWVRSIAFSPDGYMLASGSEDKTVRLWNTKTGECLQVWQEHKNRVSSVAFRPDGKILASGSDDATIRLWDVETRACIGVLEGHENWVYSVSFSPDGELLASGSEDQTVCIWKVHTGACQQILRGHKSRVYCVAFSLDGQYIASGSADKTIRLWDSETGQCLRELAGDGSFRCLAFDSSGTLLATGSDDNLVRLWDMNSDWHMRPLYGHENWVRSLAFSPDGKTLITGSDDQMVRLWEVDTTQCFRVMRGHTYWVYAVAFSPDGKTLASGGDDQTVCLWNVASGIHEQTLSEEGKVRCVTFSPNGELLASGGDNQIIRLWEVSTSISHSLLELKGHEDWVRSVAFSPDGRFLVSSSEDKTIRLWNVDTGHCLQVLSDHQDWVYCVVFNTAGTLLASASADQTVRIWDVETGRCLQVLYGHSNKVCSVAFSPDDKILASSSADQTIRLWDMSNGQCLRVLEGHTDWIFSLTFSPDGQQIASGSDDKTVRLWDRETGKCLKTLEGHTSWVYAVAISKNGELLASGSDDGTTRLWSMKSGVCLKLLRRDRPYEGMDISQVTGVNQSQREAVIALGAVASS